MSVKVLVQSARAPFLILAPVCVFLGFSTARAAGAHIDGFSLLLCVVGALLAHISVNAFNEYFDFKSGLDASTDKTPFSGGSGALPAYPAMAHAVLKLAVVSLALTILIGVFFVWKSGWAIVPIGVIGVLLIVAYTETVTRHPYVCLIAPGLGFGFLMVLGVHVVLAGSFSTLVWLVALVPFFLVNNLLLLNQFPDRHADAKVGRRHFLVVFGPEISAKMYGLFVLATVMTIVLGVGFGRFPMWSLMALLPVPLALFSLSGAFRFGDQIGSQTPYLAANVVVSLLTPVLLGVSFILA